jgi:hypothetical protein
LIEHYNGTSWTIVPSPNPQPNLGGGYPVSNELFSVVAISPTNVYAVGWSYNLVAAQTFMLRWNGSAWQNVPVPHPGRYSALRGIDAVSASDIWAVGEFDNNGNQQLAERDPRREIRDDVHGRSRLHRGCPLPTRDLHLHRHERDVVRCDVRCGGERRDCGLHHGELTTNGRQRMSGSDQDLTTSPHLPGVVLMLHPTKLLDDGPQRGEIPFEVEEEVSHR